MKKLTGRNDVRMQSGCIPYRKLDDGSVEVLLVQSTSSGRWTLPSGGLEPKLTAEANAKKETYEEAGVKGKLTYDMGTLLFIKTSTGIKQILRLYALKVKEVLEEYPESGARQRQWFTIKEAQTLSKIGKKQIKRLRRELGA